MAPVKDLEALAVGYAVGGRTGLSIVGWFLIITHVILPALGFVLALVWFFGSYALENVHMPSFAPTSIGSVLGALSFISLLGGFVYICWRGERVRKAEARK